MEIGSKLLPLNISIHSSFDEVNEFYEENNGFRLPFRSEKEPTLEDLAKGPRNLITGEPGMGKTTLLIELEKTFNKQSYKTYYITLKSAECLSQLNSALNEDTAGLTKVLFLDGLDEIAVDKRAHILEKIVDISKPDQSAHIYLSSRWNYIKKQRIISDLSYRYLAISPLSNSTVKEKIVASGHQKSDVEAFMESVIAFGHGITVIQTPRYLEYLISFLKEKDIKTIKTISRNELFDYFIDQKLRLEDTKLSGEKRPILERVLEKLALVLEIYQTNVLSKDELMTFLDDLDSDLKIILLSQIPLEAFYGNSILKDNSDSFEFDNTEFQEYLAAKELSRFSDSQRVAASFAIDRDTKSIQPTWFNTLNFLVDFEPSILKYLVEYSGIRDTQQVLDETFFLFLNKINLEPFAPELKKNLFTDVFEYHQRLRQWLSGTVAKRMTDCFDRSHLDLLKKYAVREVYDSPEQRVIQLANLSYMVAALLEVRAEVFQEEKVFWQTLLIGYATESGQTDVLQRHALEALGKFDEPTIIDALPNMIEYDELLARSFVLLCIRLDPDHEKSVRYFIQAVKKNIYYAAHGLASMTKPRSIKVFMTELAQDEVFRHELLKDFSFSSSPDQEILKHIGDNFDDEISALTMEVLVESMRGRFAYESSHAEFFAALFKLMKSKNGQFIKEYISKIQGLENADRTFFSTREMFAAALDESDIADFIESMIHASKREEAAHVLISIKLSGRNKADAIYELGRKTFATEYSNWESLRSSEPLSTEEDKTYKKFLYLLEPYPGKFMQEVFDFFVDNERLLKTKITENDLARLKKLVDESVLKVIDPLVYKLTITDQTITTNAGIFMFGPALKVANLIKPNISEYRQRIIDFIPFAYDEHLDCIFSLVKTITPCEMTGIIRMYKDRDSDLWKYRPSNLIDTAKKFFLLDAVPILQTFVTEQEIDLHTRKEAIEVANLLVPDASFLKSIFTMYLTSTVQEEQSIAITANGLLITSHKDFESIKWRVEEIIKRAQPFTRDSGVHSISAIEDELDHGKTFAKPLMSISSEDYISDYLRILDEAVKLYQKGDEYQAYAEYLWNVVYSYFEQLATKSSYQPLKLLEDKLLSYSGKKGVNWFAARMPKLRRSYLNQIAKPKTVLEAIKKYNHAKNRDRLQVVDLDSLFQLVQEIIDTDLRRWIEGEGAYELILGEKVFSSKHQEYERLIQQTIKPQIENIFLKRGFQKMDIEREVQLLDGKKVDFLIRYGFIGPIVIELKLSSNKDLKARDLEGSESYRSMCRYMDGYGASNGVFLVIKNTKTSKSSAIKEAYEKIPGVHVQYLDCNTSTDAKAPKPTSKKRVTRKTSAKKKRANKS